MSLLFRNFKKEEYIYRRYFLPALTVKLLGGIGFAMIYTFYYTYGGDTMTYFHDVDKYYNMLFTDSGTLFKFIFATANENTYYEFAGVSGYHLKGTSEFFTVIIMLIVDIFAINNYYALTVLFSSLSFVGVWSLFKLMVSKYPSLHKEMAISVLFVPSVFFWGSGLMKDTIVIGFVGLMMFFFYRIVDTKKRKILSFAPFLICAYIVFEVKAYVIISLVPTLLIWLIFNFRNQINNALLKVIILPISITILVFSMAFTLNTLGQYSEKYSIEKVLKTAKGMQSWHGVQSEDRTFSDGRGSSYTLGEYDETWSGVTSKIPAAINVTLFRPYPTEINSSVMLLASLESVGILLFSLYVFIGLGFFKTLKAINKDSFLLMALTFSLFFAFAVGFTSYNFGALVRYKIPCIPFYLASLFILKFHVQNMKKRKSY